MGRLAACRLRLLLPDQAVRPSPHADKATQPSASILSARSGLRRRCSGIRLGGALRCWKWNRTRFHTLQQPSDTTIPVESGTREPDQVIPEFDYSTIPPGYYDAVFRRRRGVQSKWHHLKFRRVVREVVGYHRVLDVGCGPGTLLGILGDDHDSVGIDVSQQQIEYARRVYGNAHRSFFDCAPSQLPGDLEPFDAITAVELIEHLPPDLVEDTIRQATERLRPGGKLVLTTPNFKSPWPLIERIVNRFGGVEYKFQHINKYSHARLRELLDSLDLQDIEVSAYLLVSPFAALLGWRLADYVAHLEAGFLVRHRGLLLVATGRKPA